MEMQRETEATRLCMPCVSSGIRQDAAAFPLAKSASPGMPNSGER